MSCKSIWEDTLLVIYQVWSVGEIRSSLFCLSVSNFALFQVSLWHYHYQFKNDFNQYLHHQCAFGHEEKNTPSCKHSSLFSWRRTEIMPSRRILASRLWFHFTSRFFMAAVCCLLAVSTGNRPSILFNRGLPTHFPMVFCLCVMHELWPLSWSWWNELSEFQLFIVSLLLQLFRKIMKRKADRC